MTKKQRAQIVSAELAAAYPSPQIPLNRRNTFTFLVAVVLSAQCTDKRVNIVTKELFNSYNTPQKIAAMPQEQLEKIIFSCGFSLTET